MGGLLWLGCHLYLGSPLPDLCPYQHPPRIGATYPVNSCALEDPSNSSDATTHRHRQLLRFCKQDQMSWSIPKRLELTLKDIFHLRALRRMRTAIVRLLFPITAPEQDRQNATMRKGSPIPRHLGMRGFVWWKRWRSESTLRLGWLCDISNSWKGAGNRNRGPRRWWVIAYAAHSKQVIGRKSTVLWRHVAGKSGRRIMISFGVPSFSKIPSFRVGGVPRRLAKIGEKLAHHSA